MIGRARSRLQKTNARGREVLRHCFVGSGPVDCSISAHWRDLDPPPDTLARILAPLHTRGVMQRQDSAPAANLVSEIVEEGTHQKDAAPAGQPQFRLIGQSIAQIASKVESVALVGKGPFTAVAVVV